MDYLQQRFSVSFEYKVFFTAHLFAADNSLFKDFLQTAATDTVKKVFFVIDEGVAVHHTYLQEEIRNYFKDITHFSLVEDIVVIPGGEKAKNDERCFYRIVEAVNKWGIDRHSYIVAIGGGSILDLVGYAAAVSHRSIRHIRIPTTVLSQNDSGVGVKNGINYYGKKNFLGAFAPPAAVFNDAAFLTTLSNEEWRSGMSEAVKVALIKDAAFFEWLEENAGALTSRDSTAMQYLIKRCAELHLEHIRSGDPFEMGSSRPLDFGHWSAHKVEQLSDFTIRHGEAVAMGIALDSAYSFLSGRLKEESARRIVYLLKNIGYAITHPLMEVTNEDSPVLKGLNEFREHLGGKLTIMLLEAIGKGEEVNELDTTLLKKAAVGYSSLSKIVFTGYNLLILSIQMKTALIFLAVGIIILPLMALLLYITFTGAGIDFHIHDTYYVMSSKSVITFSILFLATLFFTGASIATQFRNIILLICLIVFVTTDIYFYRKWTGAYKNVMDELNQKMREQAMKSR